MKKILTTTALLNVFAFDGDGAGWKLDEDGHIELKDGNPIYIDGSGREMTVGQETIGKLNGEAKTHREAKEKAEAELETLKEKYKGVDPDKAKEAIEKLSKIDQKKLIDAGEVDKVKDEIKSQFTEQLNEKEKENAELQSRLDNMMIDDVFKSSEFVRDSVAVPHDMFKDSFRKNFKIEDGKITAYGNDGNRLMSKEKAGEYATPEEALKILVDSHAQKDVILKADGGTGSGGSGGGTRGGMRTVKRSEMEKMSPQQQAEIAGKAGKGEVNIVD